MRKYVRYVGIFVVIILLITITMGYWFAHKSIVPTQGMLETTALENEATIYRDEWGIPHIYANTLEDAYFAQGYAQAQDRLFEMDLSRRAVRGELSEVLGEGLLDADKFFLTIGFYRAAEESELIMTEDGKRYLQSYSDGVNAFIEDNKENLPIEFSLLGYQPDEWSIVDSLAIGKYMSWVLGGNMETELLLMATTEKIGEEKAKEIFPAYPEDGITIMKEAWREAGMGSLEMEQMLSLLDIADREKLGVPGVGLGSNNWVVSGSMTESGKPILANDMHLEVKAPSIWYQNHLKVPNQLNVTGVIFPGVPGVIVGHNDHVAWGVTNLNPDVQDLYIEKPNPDNKYQFEYMGKWEDAKVVEYSIPVKGKDAVPFEVVITRHGPIISSVFDQPESIPLALKWTNLEPTSELDAVLLMDTATDWESFKKGLDYFKVPAQNFVYADVDGNIAYRGNGLIPIRTKGDGQLPVPGWTGEYEWSGYIPYDELPTVINPEQGFLVTANNKAIDDDYPYFLTNEWAPEYRATSIYESLNGRTDLTVEDVVAVQNNWNNLQAETLSPIINKALASGTFTDTEEAAKQSLLEWLNNSPQDLPDSTGPTIYHTLYLQILENTFKDELGDDLYKSYLSHGNSVNTLDRFLLNDSGWFDDVTTPAVETKEEIIVTAFKETVVDLKEELGSNVDKWKWGEIHTITYDHPLGQNKVLALFFNKGSYKMGGSSVTAGAASYSYSDPYEVTSSAPWRYGVDLGNMDGGLDILFGGSSGHPFSDNYDDQIDKWLDGEYKQMWFNDEDIKKAAGDRITIIRP